MECPLEQQTGCHEWVEHGDISDWSSTECGRWTWRPTLIMWQRERRNSMFGPQFSSDNSADGPWESLKFASFNCGGLSPANANSRIAIIGNWMLQEDIDILAIQDTRLLKHQHKILIDQIRVILAYGCGVFAGLGDGAGVLASHACKNSKTDVHSVGGQLIILSPKLAGCVTNVSHDKLQLGIISSVQLKYKGQCIQLISVYVPFPAYNNESENRLHNKTKSALLEHGYTGSVNQYITDKVTQLTAQNEHPVILLGDFNATWKKQVGRIEVAELALSLSMSRAIDSGKEYKTRHAGGKLYSGIDHLLYSQHAHIKLGAAYVDENIFRSISDHLPVIGQFNIQCNGGEGHMKARSDTKRFNGKLRKIQYLDIDRGNADQVILYQKTFIDLSKQIMEAWHAEECSAHMLLEELSWISSQAVRKSLRRVTKARRSGKYRWSPGAEYIRQHVCHLQRMQTSLQKYAKPWTNALITDIHAELVDDLHLSIVDLHLPSECREWITAQTDFSWPTDDNEGQLKLQICRLKQLLANRLTNELSASIKRAVKTRNNKFASGKIGSVLQSLMEKYKTPYDMSLLPLDNGDILTDSRDIHAAHASFWDEWFQGDQSASGLIDNDVNPQKLLTDFELFRNSIASHHIPDEIALVIWKGINSTSISRNDEDCVRHRVEAELRISLQEPPSIDELKRTIRGLPTASAGGISGLTYNQLKIWPDSIIAAAHAALVVIWNQQSHPEFFKFKWLVPLSKLKEAGTPTLKQLRPIMLIEALRKVWVQLLVKRIRRTLEKQEALSGSQYGFRAGRSTMQPLLQFGCALEQVAEVGGSMSGSTWDIVRAFDSIAKPLLQLAMVRIGIPDRWSRYLIKLDEDSRIIVRSPWAENYIRNKGTQKLLGDVVKGNGPQFFHAQRGVGQGDVGSPTIWNIFMDMLICSIQQVDYTPIYMQSYSGQCIRMTDTAYADDLLTCSATKDGLQAKAEVVSAFSIIMKISIAIHKLRSFTTSDIAPEDATIIVHTGNWIPNATPLKNEVDIEYLGIIFHISPHLAKPIYDNAYVKTYNKAKSTLQVINGKRVYANAKISAAALCVMSQVAYVGQFAAWTDKQHQGLTRLFSQFYRRALHHMPSFPTKLLYAPMECAGLQLAQPDDTIQVRKWSMFQRLSHSKNPSSRNLKDVLLGRATRLARLPYGAPDKLSIPFIDGAEYWLGSLLNRLGKANIHMTVPPIWYSDCIPLPPEILHSDWACHLNLLTINDLSFPDEAQRSLPLELVTVHFPKKLNFSSWQPSQFVDLTCPEFTVPSYHGLSIPILPNQCWLVLSKSSPNICIAEILGQDESHIHVHIWESIEELCATTYEGHPYIRLRTTVQGGGSGVIIPISTIMGDKAMRFILSSDALHSTFGIIRTILYSAHDTPTLPTRWQPPTQLSHDIIEAIKNIPNPIIFSDGSVVTRRTGSEEICQDGGVITAGAGIVVISNTQEWQLLPSLGIHLSLLPEFCSSFLAELSGLCIASEIRRQISDQTTIISDCLGAIHAISSYRNYNGLVGESLIYSCRELVQGGKAIEWHRSHPERRGGSTCIRDFGIQLADHYAANQADLHQSFQLEASSMRHLPVMGTQLIFHGKLLIDSLKQTFNKQYHTEYIKERNQQSRFLYGTWSNPSGKLAKDQWLLSTSRYARSARAQRFIWDKLVHPRHPALHAPLECPFCKITSGLEHIIIHCKHPVMEEARIQIYTAIEKQIQSLADQPVTQSICSLLHDTARNHQYGIRIWTGLWNREMRNTIDTQIAEFSNSSIRAARKQIIVFLNIYTQGLGHIWKAWQQWILPTSTDLLQAFPKLVKKRTHQLSMRSFTVKKIFKKDYIKSAILAKKRERGMETSQVPCALPEIITLPALKGQNKTKQGLNTDSIQTIPDESTLSLLTNSLRSQPYKSLSTSTYKPPPLHSLFLPKNGPPCAPVSSRTDSLCVQHPISSHFSLSSRSGIG